jgi:hypothetical protein
MKSTFEDAFPKLRAVRAMVHLGDEFSWATRFSWDDEAAIMSFGRIVVERQLLAAEHDFEWLEELSDAVLADLKELVHPNHDETASRSILFLRFLFSVVVMENAYALGRRGPAFDWMFRGLSFDHDPAKRYNSGQSYLPLRGVGDPRVASISLRWLPRWCVTMFMMARDGSVPRAEAETFAGIWDVLVKYLELDGHRFPNLPTEIYAALASFASWAVSEDFDRRDEWVEFLVDAWNRDAIPLPAASIVATVFITRANSLTGRSIRDWSLDVLDKLGAQLREHERLQFLVASVDTHERWQNERTAVFEEIEALNMRAYEAAEVGASPLYVREARLDVIKPLIRTLVVGQDLAGAMDLIRAWYRQPGTASCDDNVLFVHPAIEDGVAILWPGRARISLQTTPGGHDVVIDAIANALGVKTVPDGEPVDENREGIPDYGRGGEVEAAMTRYYQPAALARQFKKMSEPRSLVVFPSVADPLQALLAKELGVMLPLEISLAQPEIQRPIRVISIWAGFTHFTHFEVDVIDTFAAKNGWAVSVFPGSEDGDADDFRRFYEQAEPDLLWVCGHGEFVTHRPSETGMVVSTPRAERVNGQYEDEILPMETIATFAVPGAGRRLLVLNTCNGATTQGMAGMARIGLAQSLVGPHQLVAGHLWPASSALGLAFGSLFISNLEGREIRDAFGATLKELRSPEAIVDLIQERMGGSFAGGFRISSCVNELSSIMAWGCPVLLT